jgi:hypothetical protein
MLKTRKKIQKMVKLKLPSLSVSGDKTITIFEVGNLDRGFIPSEKDLAYYRDLIKKATEEKKSFIFVPEGLVRVTQFAL